MPESCIHPFKLLRAKKYALMTIDDDNPSSSDNEHGPAEKAEGTKGTAHISPLHKVAKANSARALPQALHANDAKLSSSSTTPSVSTAAPQASGSPWSTDDVSDGQEHDIVNHHTEGENNPKDVSTDDSAVSLGILVDGVESGSTADGASLQVSVTPAEVVSGALVGGSESDSTGQGESEDVLEPQSLLPPRWRMGRFVFSCVAQSMPC
ncbi:hypothetical protein GLOTRDRAFT_128728 [Gloeophyllum trabeum ATCC 11539]|uniref:Uncharacterized protein n=1 Tax=Gloeophyllum trabeum (strain ATCC 11539 / FP-39264 / Madison 617) TaxID=670483 RepID=S7Q7K4_GLOTA|nr:uncharacterized protein GLOTRDRAFT_128728 [Gloeophyllum trabeum ATCC 11539]EPQ55497.1 hypothetical protein GLOTRDRAFT_128728 [Gloeophyllum trabeum ATCC 11539]